MVYLDFVSDDGNVVVYDYRPEKPSAQPGRLSVSRSGTSREVLSKSPDDWYDGFIVHAFNRVEEMIQAGELERYTYAAWF